MYLDASLISQFVKATNDSKPAKSEQTVYGTVVIYDEKKYVKIDGSELLTPIAATTKVDNDERVMVLIKNHTATVTGNLTSPSARDSDVETIGTKITEFETIIADKVDTLQLNAVSGRIDDLQTDFVTVKGSLTAVNADITNLEADNVTIKESLTAAEADIEDLTAQNVTVTGKLEAAEADIGTLQADNVLIREDLTAQNAYITNLESTFGNFKVLTTEKLTANEASIEELEAKYAEIESLDTKYANIDFTNIGEAAIETLFSKSGLIEDIIVSNGTITGNLVGVTIKGDLIEGGTVVADKLVVKGEDGLYYKLNTDGVTTEAEQTEYNSLNGSVITAQSITATKIAVDDLVAFDATIGGFEITDNAIHSVVKTSVDNTTRGIYLDNTGQMAVGDAANHIKYYKDTDGTYKLAISASNILLSSGKSMSDLVDEVETVQSTADEAKDSAGSAQATADSQKNLLSNAMNEIDSLKNAISTLVTGRNRESLMVQTENGWQFNMSDVLDALDTNSSNINALDSELSETNNQVDILDQAVVKLGEYTGYIKFALDNGLPCIILGATDSDFKVKITNTAIKLMEGTKSPAIITNNRIEIETAYIKGQFQQGGFAWAARSNGNCGLVWRG